MIPQNLHFKKTRIAPTPSGYLHLGNVLSFILTAELAKKHGAKILLRIDDLDRERANKLYIQDIFDTLDFMEIAWDEGPRNLHDLEQEWSQLHRMDSYNYTLQQLKEGGYLFACTCSRAQVRGESNSEVYTGTCLHKTIPFDTKDSCWRLKTDALQEITIKTLTQGNLKTILPAQMHHFIVRKKDGYPTYQLASLIDDFHFGIDLIVRGNDLLPSTLAQGYLSRFIDDKKFNNITFHHHPLLMSLDDKKLSKSAGDTSIKQLRTSEKKAADIYNLIGKMYGINEPIKDSNELCSYFFKG